jgi:outer membrane protein assembly factor BamB
VIHSGAAVSRRRLLLGLGTVALVGAGATACALRRQLWSHDLRHPVRGFALGDGVVYATGGDYRGSAVAIDIGTGEARWTYDLETPRRSPVTVDDLVIVDDRYGVHALDAATGTRRWMDEEAWLVDAGDGIVLCGRETADRVHVLDAVDAATGEARWTVQSGLGPYEPAALAAGRVHLGLGDVLRTLDAATGATVWEQPVRSVVGVTAAGSIVCCTEETDLADLVGDERFGGDWDAIVKEQLEYGRTSHVAFDAASGGQLWRKKDTGAGPVSACDGALYVSGGSTLEVWDAATGSTRWRGTPRELTGIRTAPVVAGGICYVANIYGHGSRVVEHDGRFSTVEDRGARLVLFALAADDGKARWSVEIDFDRYSEDIGGTLPLVVVGDTVVIGTDAGTVVGIA